VERIGDAARRLLAELEARVAEGKKASGGRNEPEQIQLADGYGLSSTPAVRPSRDDSVGTDRATSGVTLPADRNAGRVQYGAHEPAAEGTKAPICPLPPAQRLRSRRRNAILQPANDNVAHWRSPSYGEGSPRK
jgi:hypothetical protein